VSIDDVTENLMGCTCPHHVHRNAFCKHMAAVENATDDGTLEAFPSEDDEDDAELILLALLIKKYLTRDLYTDIMESFDTTYLLTRDQRIAHRGT
jgi:hypothetical protein